MENDCMKPLTEKLGDKAGQFRIKMEPHGDKPFYLYKYNHAGGLYLAINAEGDTWVYSLEANRYVPSDWQTELNRFAATLDKELQPCSQPGCYCQSLKEQAEMAEHRSSWESEILAARQAKAEPYSREHRDSQFESFCRMSERWDGKPVIRFPGSRKDFEKGLKALGIKVGQPFNPTQKGPVN